MGPLTTDHPDRTEAGFVAKIDAHGGSSAPAAMAAILRIPALFSVTCKIRAIREIRG